MATPIYCTRDDVVAMSLSADQFAALDDATVQQLVIKANSEAHPYLAARYALPLLSWGDDLRGWIADIAAYFIMRRVGYSITAGSNDTWRDGYDDAIEKLSQVRNRMLHPDVLDSARRSPVPMAYSKPLRGW